MTPLSYYTRRPHREQADLDLAGDGDALALHGRLQDVAFLDGGSLPSKPDEIRRRAGVSVALWKSWPGKVERKWPLSTDGTRRVNADLAEELGRVESLLAARSKGGKATNRKRWPKPDPSSSAIAQQQLSDSSATTERQLSDCSVSLSGLEGIGLERKGGDCASRHTLPDVLAFAKAEGISEKSAQRYYLTRSEQGWRGVKDFRPGLKKWSGEDMEKDAAKSKTPQPAPTGNRTIHSLHEVDDSPAGAEARANCETCQRKKAGAG